MKKKILCFLLASIFCLSAVGMLGGCKDYGYYFHYRVDGGNGEIEIEKTTGFQPAKSLCNESWCELNCPENSFYFQSMGNKKGSRTLTFIAIPAEGYKVKEWCYNGEIVKGNKTNTYTATVSYKEKYNAVITVKFEIINNN